MQSKPKESALRLRLISLNTWGGRAMHSLMHFFKQHQNDADIFCLQEMHDTTQEYRENKHPDEWVRWDLWDKTQKALPGFSGHFARFKDNPDRMTVAMFIRKDIYFDRVDSFDIFWPEKPVEEGSMILSPRKIQLTRLSERTTLGEKGSRVLIANYHGLWTSAGKLDSPERLVQSIRIKGLLEDYSYIPTIFCGDFNLEPQTQSMAILEKDMCNLIKKSYWIKSTRTPLYRSCNDPKESQFADYILVSPEVKVNDFQVMPDLCSDHAPLYLDFSIL